MKNRQDTTPLDTLALSDANIDIVLPAFTATASEANANDSPAYADKRRPATTPISDAATRTSLDTSNDAEAAEPDTWEPDDTDIPPALSTDADELDTNTSPPLNTSADSSATTDKEPDESSTELPPSTLMLSPTTRTESPADTSNELPADTDTESDEALKDSPDTISNTREDDTLSLIHI